MTLFIALPPPLPGPALSPGWRHAVSKDGLAVDSHGTAPASLLPRDAGEIVAVLPASAVSWHALKLPQLPRGTGPARMRAVLEGLLEEHVLDDPAALHIALEPGRHTGQPAGHTVWAACCDKTWLTEALQQLEHEGLRATRLLPALPPRGAGEPARVLLAGEAGQPLLHVQAATGVWTLPVHSADDVQAALAIAGVALAPSAPTDAPPGASAVDAPQDDAAPAIDLVTEPAVAALAEKWLPGPPRLRPAEQGWLQVYAGDHDLAQFDLRLSGRGHALRRWRKVAQRWWHAPEWRPARVGVLTLVAAQLIGLNAWAWTLQRDLETARRGIAQSLTQTFPNVRVVVDAPLQMSREVAQLRQAAGQTSPQDLEAMLAGLAAALPTQQRLQRLSYASGELQFSGPALTPEQLADAQDPLQAQGLRLQPGGGSGQWTLAAGLPRAPGGPR